MNKQQLQKLADEALSETGPYTYKQATEPTPRVTKFFGQIYQGNQFVSRIGTSMAEQIVDSLNNTDEMLMALRELCITMRAYWNTAGDVHPTLWAERLQAANKALVSAENLVAQKRGIAKA